MRRRPLIYWLLLAMKHVEFGSDRSSIADDLGTSIRLKFSESLPALARSLPAGQPMTLRLGNRDRRSHLRLKAIVLRRNDRVD
jgi:hypothetical protein